MIQAGGIRVLLRDRYASPAWCLLEEVANGTGAGASRYADAVALSLWPSRGIELHGFEIKVSRQDLRGELVNPKKADAIGKYCDYWWLVLADESLREGLEVPPTWGVQAPKKKSLHTFKAAVKNEAREPWTPGFIASLMRRFSENAISMEAHRERLSFLSAKHEQEVEAAVTKQVGAKLEQAHRERDQAKAELAALRERTHAFERSLGMTMEMFRPNVDPYEVGRALRAIWDVQHRRRVVDGFHGAVAQLDACERSARDLREQIKFALDRLGEVVPAGEDPSHGT